MQDASTITITKFSWINFLQTLSKWLNRIAPLACAAIVLYVVGYFIFEAYYPPAPVVINPNAPGPFFIDAAGGSRAPSLVNPALRWLARILFVPANVNLITALVFVWANKTCGKKILLGLIMFAASFLLWLAGSLSCGC